MTVHKAPWFMGQAGVLHSAEVARVQAYAAMNGSGGVIGTTDCRVMPTATPSGRVIVTPGGVGVLNDYPGAYAQAYIGAVTATETLSIDPTTSSGPRSDLVVARVYDPQYTTVAGYDAANANAFQFFRIEVIKGITPGTRRILNAGYPVEPLARIDLPASTATVTAGMIVDVRQKANQRTARKVIPAYPAGDLNLTSSTYTPWPANTMGMVRIPEWATKAVVTTLISSVEFIPGKVADKTVIGLMGSLGPYSDNQNSVYIGDKGMPSRFPIVHTSSYSLPPAARGAEVGVLLRGARSAGTGVFQIDYQSTVQYAVDFMEDVE